MSPLGADYPRERFLLTPVSTIRKILSTLSDEEQRRANVASRSTASLAHLIASVAHGFSKSAGSPMKFGANVFLPYPDWKPAGDTKSGPDEGTKFVLSQLVQSRRIPLHVFTALVTPPSAS